MATFEELMETFRNPGDDGVPETFADELTGAYTDEISIREAAITERDAKIAAAAKLQEAAQLENIRLKAVNYDLIKAAPNPEQPGTKDELPDSDESGGIDSLFE